MNLLITGSSGFIGSNLSARLAKNHNIFGIDLNSNKPTDIKEKIQIDQDIDCVIHLAALAGVRKSIENPNNYIDTNIKGFNNVLEYCAQNNIKKLLYASSSSVYGNCETPAKETDNVDNQMSPYAFTKRSNELQANLYENLYSIKTIGMRFFTVYGNNGRKDMAIHKFSEKIKSNEEFVVYGLGKLKRDFTHVDYVVSRIEQLLENDCKHNIYNIGNGNPRTLNELIAILQKKYNKQAKIKYQEKPDCDVYQTWSCNERIESEFGVIPKKELERGI